MSFFLSSQNSHTSKTKSEKIEQKNNLAHHTIYFLDIYHYTPNTQETRKKSETKTKKKDASLKMPLPVLAARRASPIHILSTIWLLVPIFCIIVFLFNRSTPYPTNSLGPDDKSTVYKVNWNGTIPADKTAYVYTYMGGRWDSTQRFVATLTSIEALRRTNTQRDIVVMIDDEVTDENIEKFKTHGVIVHHIRGNDLFKNHALNPEKIQKERHDDDIFANKKNQITAIKPLPLNEFCYSNFAPIYAWTLEQYDRVIWLDADVLPQLRMDEYFLCGEFCLTYANLQWYIASVIVLKPSYNTFNRLYTNISTNLSTKSKLTDLSNSFWPGITQCQSIFEEYLLSSFYHLESSPLFNPELPTAKGGGQQHVPSMRLNMGVVINGIYWYEKYNWSLARGAAYAHMVSESEFNIPGHSIGFPTSKPYDWFQSIYWNTNWVWAHWRSVLLNESFFSIGVYVLGIGFLTLGGSLILIQILLKPVPKKDIFVNNDLSDFNNPNLPTNLLRTHRQTSFLFKIISLFYRIGGQFLMSFLAFFTGLFIVLLTGYCAYCVIPPHTIYYIAWPIFAILISLLQYTSLVWVNFILSHSCNGVSMMSKCKEIVDKAYNNDFSALIQNNLKFGKNNDQNQSEPSTKLSTKDLLNYKMELSRTEENAKLITSDPQKALLFFLNFEQQNLKIHPKNNGQNINQNDQNIPSRISKPTKPTLSPLSQYFITSALLNHTTILVNILIIICVYLINQFHIFPHFAVKIIVLFLGVLYALLSFVKPYLTLFTIYFYSYNGLFAWNK